MLAQSPDLAFLKYFSGLRLLDLEVYDLESLNGLAYVRDSLETFHFGKTAKVFPLRFSNIFRICETFLLADTSRKSTCWAASSILRS
jgi:hypothetical protein